MLQRINKLFLNIHFFIILCVVVIVLLTKFNEGTRDWLKIATQEGGIFEWGSFFLAFIIAGFGSMIYIHSREAKVFRKSRRKLILVIAVLSYLAAMEEISWGQHIFGFASNEFFDNNNLQRETNLHNFISGEYLNLVIYGLVNVFFIYLPLFVYFNPNLINHSPSIRGKITIYLPSIHNVLMFCFASSLQAYFMLKTMADTILLITAMLLILLLLVKNKKYRSNFHLLHYFVVAGAIGIFMLSHEVLDYFNMQYEIREFVVLYAFLYWFYNWTSNLKNKVALQLK